MPLEPRAMNDCKSVLSSVHRWLVRPELKRRRRWVRFELPDFTDGDQASGPDKSLYFPQVIVAPLIAAYRFLPDEVEVGRRKVYLPDVLLDDF